MNSSKVFFRESELCSVLGLPARVGEVAMRSWLVLAKREEGERCCKLAAGTEPCTPSTKTQAKLDYIIRTVLPTAKMTEGHMPTGKGT